MAGAGFLIRARSTKRRLFLLRPERLWGLPGGHVEPDEDELQCAIRELAEETRYVGPVGLEGHIRVNRRYMVFFGLISKEFTPKLNHEHVGFSWATLEDPPTPLRPGLSKVLDEAWE